MVHMKKYAVVLVAGVAIGLFWTQAALAHLSRAILPMINPRPSPSRPLLPTMGTLNRPVHPVVAQATGRGSCPVDHRLLDPARAPLHRWSTQSWPSRRDAAGHGAYGGWWRGCPTQGPPQPGMRPMPGMMGGINDPFAGPTGGRSMPGMPGMMPFGPMGMGDPEMFKLQQKDMELEQQSRRIGHAIPEPGRVQRGSRETQATSH